MYKRQLAIGLSVFENVFVCVKPIASTMINVSVFTLLNLSYLATYTGITSELPTTSYWQE